ncbi:MAG TPA: PhnD/SsuA/transferrin family substrate-binding protein [Kofleriaceae bacterium]|nr:PhnD/SsuA/transferrin family substrate-binding protein [Kofleriaceae bacterium]
MKLFLILALLCTPVIARADDTITIGLYAPTAPFGGTGDRVSFVNALADHLSSSAGGRKVQGKVFSSAGAFAAAVQKGDVQFAIVDAPYAAAQGLPYHILASAVRGGGSTGAWILVGRAGVAHLSDLKGKKIVAPATGAKQGAFITNALFEGEIDATFFDKILDAADPKSALTMVSVGKADAAVVPSGVEVPGGLSTVMTLRSIGWPMFVAAPGANAELEKSFAAAITSFSSGGAFSGFAAGDAGHYRALAGSFGKDVKKGPLAVPPPARLSVRDLLEGRSFTLPSSNVLDLIK